MLTPKQFKIDFGLSAMKTGLLSGLLGVHFLCASASALTILDFDVYGVGWFGKSIKGVSDYDVTVVANAMVAAYNQDQARSQSLNGFTLAETTLGMLPGPLSFGSKAERLVSVDPQARDYILGKYGNSSYLFYVGEVTDVVRLPRNLGGHDLSHQVVFEAERTSVPDGGTTMLLLGIALLGLEMFRRRFNVTSAPR